MANVARELEFELAKLMGCYEEPPFNESIPISVIKHKEWEDKMALVRNVTNKIVELVEETKKKK